MKSAKTETPDRKGNRSSTVFKTGAISLVFLVIGYQTALFINRAAMLGIEAVRDRPDTVYIVEYLAPEGLPSTAGPASGSASASSPAGAAASRYGSPGGGNYDYAPRVVRRDTIRRNSSHSRAVAEVRERTRKVESFNFNPNTVSEEELVRLGFSSKQARSIINYREKGGRYRRKSDFAKSFVVSDSIYRRLEKYIVIPTVDINVADSAAFDELPGIGPYFAAKMVEYRERLGGYSYTSQLLDIYNFGQDRFDAISDLISCSEPEPFRLWSLTEDELCRHPYIKDRKTARAIVLYRENNPASELSVEGLASAGILSAENAVKLAGCRIEKANASGDV